MKNRSLLDSVLILLALSCTTKKPYHEVAVSNPAFIPVTAFYSFEDLTSPKFSVLKNKYQLDTVFHGEKDERNRTGT